jgi:hypothetical protein
MSMPPPSQSRNNRGKLEVWRGHASYCGARRDLASRVSRRHSQTEKNLGWHVQPRQVALRKTNQPHGAEANSCSPCQENHHLLWNTKIHRRVHNSPPVISILSQSNGIHVLFPVSFKHPINSVLSTPRSPKWSLYFRCSACMNLFFLCQNQWASDSVLNRYASVNLFFYIFNDFWSDA